MPALPFPEWKPDISDFQGASSLTIQNVLPRGDGYGPFPDFQALTANLAGPSRGFFFARNADGSIAVFAGTATNLYKLNNTSLAWANVSLSGGPYSALSAGFNWQFLQFNNFVMATQQNVVVQVYDLTSSSAFAVLGGTPPQASYITNINRFVVLSGIQGFPYRVQWSGLDATTTWDNVTSQSNLQDMADGGTVQGVGGGDQYGIIFQDAVARSMTFNPGSAEVFDIYKIANSSGIFAAGSAVSAGGQTYYIATDGFKVIPPGGYPTPIAKEKFDRTFFNNVDSANLQLCMAAADPKGTRVYWCYKSLAGTAGQFDTLIVYDYVLQRGATIAMNGQFIASLAKPGLTLEGLDAIAPGVEAITGAANNGSGLIRLTVASTAAYTTGQIKAISGVVGTTEANGNWVITVHSATTIDLQGSAFVNAYSSGGIVGGSLDALTFSLDTVANSTQAAFAAAGTSNAVGFFAGSNLAAMLQTAEQGDDMNRMRIRGMRPITDATSVICSAVYRETLQANPTVSSGSALNVSGLAPMNISTRFARGQVVIPYGAVWTFASGIVPVVTAEGQQ